MIESFLDSIKGPRRLPLTHWRYRLLHWCFGVNPASAEESTLARALYTHYCPLFHMTNLIAIFAPVILVVKVLGFLLGVALLGCRALDAARERWLARQLAAAANSTQPGKTNEQLADEDRASLLEILRKHPEFGPSNFSEFKARLITKLVHLSDDELRDEYLKITTALTISRLRAKRWKDKQRAWIIFWVNFSRVFIKIVLTTFYAALFLFVAYVTVRFGGGAILWCLGLAADLWWLVTDINYGDVLNVTVRVGIVASVTVGAFYVLWKFRAILLTPIDPLFRKLMPPLELVGDVFAAFFGWCGATAKSIGEFVAMFYEENCPPIEIVTKADAAADDGGPQ